LETDRLGDDEERHSRCTSPPPSAPPQQVAMEEETVVLDPKEYTFTSTGNIVSRKSELHGSTKIRVHPKVHTPFS
jgi:hypothetical protein